MMAQTPVSPRRHVALIGLMGVGKTAVGAAVGRRTGRRHIDLDRAVTQLAGRSIGVIFHESGEQAFRDLEAECLALHLTLEDPLVLSTGGGVLGREENREALAAATVVWLRASTSTLAARVGDGAGRPLLADDDPVAVIERLVVERVPAYKAAADFVVDTDDRTVDEVADAVIEALWELEPVGGAR